MNIPKINLDPKNPKLRNAAIIIVAGLGGAVAWHQMVYVKKQAQITELTATRQKKEGDLNGILAMKNQLEKLRQDTARSNVKLDSLKSIFPDQKEIPKLILEITRMARGAGVETRKFSPLPDVEKEYYVENRYAMAVVGSYHQVATFFSYLANMPLLVNLSEVNLASKSPGAQQAGAAEFEGSDAPKTVIATFKMTTFSSKK